MQKYQAAQLEELRTDTSLESQEDAAGTSLKQRLLEMIRPLSEADLERIRNVQTPHELIDCSHHFHLHYGADLASMREFEARMVAKEKKPASSNKEKKKKKKKKKNIGDEEEGGGEGEEEEEEDEEGDDDEEEDEEDEEEEEVVDEAAGAETKVVKYASKKDRYHHCKLAGLCGLAKKFGLSPEQLGENLESEYQKHEIDQWAIAPVDEAQNYVKEPYFSSTEHVNTFIHLFAALVLWLNLFFTLNFLVE